MTTAIKPMVLHSQSKAESIANSCTKNDCSNSYFDEPYFTYKAIPWGDKYWAVEVSDDIGVIGYL